MAYSVVGGGLSTYIPSTNDLATGALQVEFTRTVNSFALSRYAQLVPVTKMTGYYLRQDVTDNVRVTDQNEFIWPLGNDRPTGKQNAFDFVQYSTARYAFPFYIPQETTQQAAWDVVAQHARAKAQLAMTRRTMAAASTLATTGNWGTNYTSAAGTSVNAWTATGDWSLATASNRWIQKSIQQVMQLVGQSSGGAVSPNQLIMVISPNVAAKISQSAEVLEYVKYNPASPSFLQGSDTYSRWGIPPTLFGLGDVVVDDSVKVTTKKNTSGTATYSYVLGNGAYFVSRPGGLVGVEGANSFATLQIFAYEDMTVEQFNDPVNRRIEGRVIDNSTPAVVAPVAGYLISNVLA
jgi:hypothetical protein